MTAARPKNERTLTARWIFPVDRDPIPDGMITIREDRIVAVEARGQRRADEDLGNVAILPGLVNAHTHLDLTGLRGLTPPTSDFTTWLRQVINHRRTVTPDQVQLGIQAGLDESLQLGTTLLGDISSQGQSWPMLVQAPLRAVVFHELLGLTADHARQAWEGLLEWMLGCTNTETCRQGLSPHAPYSVRRSLLEQSATMNCPLAIHLAETRAELELLQHRSGSFMDFLAELGAWDPEGLVQSPQQLVDIFRHHSQVLWIHGNYLDPSTRLRSNDTIVYCPRTHAAFGHPPHPFREFLSRGTRVALGTDSLASNPDLDMLAEARFLHRHYPDIPGETLLRMATLWGAEALGWNEVTGSLTPGKSADLVALPLSDGNPTDPHELVLDSEAVVKRVMFRGKWL
jgi:cytosine/adenosine deaminase-related metal-dependent hydrolase